MRKEIIANSATELDRLFNDILRLEHHVDRIDYETLLDLEVFIQKKDEEKRDRLLIVISKDTKLKIEKKRNEYYKKLIAKILIAKRDSNNDKNRKDFYDSKIIELNEYCNMDFDSWFDEYTELLDLPKLIEFIEEEGLDELNEIYDLDFDNRYVLSIVIDRIEELDNERNNLNLFKDTYWGYNQKALEVLHVFLERNKILHIGLDDFFAIMKEGSNDKLNLNRVKNGKISYNKKDLAYLLYKIQMFFKPIYKTNKSTYKKFLLTKITIDNNDVTDNYISRDVRGYNKENDLPNRHEEINSLIEDIQSKYIE